MQMNGKNDCGYYPGADKPRGGTEHYSWFIEDHKKGR